MATDPESTAAAAAGRGPGDVELAALLTAAGSGQSAAEARAIVAGVLAAPVGFDPDAWLDLLAPPDAAELRRALRALHATMAVQPHHDPPGADRLVAVRLQLAEQGIDGFVLPLTDEHRNEYVPAAAQRLAWLTGFTGSAGLAVVLDDRAALFVDGRYTVQAEAETDGALWARHHLIDQPPDRWLGTALRPGQRLAYDPNLHTKAEVERYRRACDRAGSHLVALGRNPVDAVWSGRPPPPIAPVTVLDDTLTGEPSAAKRRRMGRLVGEAGARMAVIGAPDSIAWLLDLRGGDVPFNPLVLSFALLHDDGAVELFVDRRKLCPGQDLGDGVSIQAIDGFGAALDGLGHAGAVVLVDPARTSVGVIDRLVAGGARVVEGDDPCVLAKARKNPVELEGARRAQRRDGAAVCRFLCWLDDALRTSHVTEREAAERLESERRRDPLFRGPSFETISASGTNAALPHYRVTPTSDRVIAPGLYLVDSGGQYLDATTDITRTVAVGTPDAEMARHFTLVLRGHLALARARFPAGTTGAQLDGLARRPLWQAGLDYDHGTGHGIGSYLCVHEGPQRIAKTGGVALQPGMIVSNEPGYYRPGSHGIRIENLVAVVPRGVPPGGDRELLGFETLTLAPIDRRLIVTTMLDAAERAWLDNYHARVRAELIDLLAPTARSWLLATTAPLV